MQSAPQVLLPFLLMCSLGSCLRFCLLLYILYESVLLMPLMSVHTRASAALIAAADNVALVQR